MSGSRQFHEKCVCGAEITITENYDFISSSKQSELFEQWRSVHKRCLPLFLEIQQVRVDKLKMLMGGG